MKRIAIIVGFVAAVGLGAHAANLGTGLDGFGNLILPGVTEQNYTVTDLGSDPVPALSGAVVGAQAFYYGSPWVANTPAGQWISPKLPDPVINGGSQAAPQFWGFTYNQKVSGFLSLSFSSDNPSELLVNGNQVARSQGWPDMSDTSDYTRWVNYSANIPANSTVEFIVWNDPYTSSPPGNPAGLIVNGTVPDGGLTSILLGMGMLGLGAIRRKLR